MSETHVSVLIPCAGSGKRMGEKIPKQFLEIEGKPIFFYTIQKFERCSSVNDIILIVPEDYLKETENYMNNWSFQKIKCVVTGGKERQDSVKNGLNALSEVTDIILIHDGVRPFISLDKIDSIIQEVKDHGAAIMAVPTKNTVKEVRNGWVKSTLDRNVLWQIQTPQGFRKELLQKAYGYAEQSGIYGTDDAMLVEAIHHPVKIVEGDDQNIKITCPNDLLIAKTWIREGVA